MSRSVLLLLPGLLVACNVEVGVLNLASEDDSADEPVVGDTTDTAADTATDTVVDPVDTSEPVELGNSTTFENAGEHVFVVPANVYVVEVAAWGGGGAGGNQHGATGGGGAFATARLPVTPGETLAVWVAEVTAQSASACTTVDVPTVK